MGRWTSRDPKPRVPFCWWCGHRLFGRQHVEVELEGERRVLHKNCERDAREGTRELTAREVQLDA